MRIIAPDQEKRISRNVRRERRRWDDADTQSLALGCLGCLELNTCGGMRKRQDHYWCLDDCCGNPATCDVVCPKNISTFIRRLREINGFDLQNIPRANPHPAAPLPSYVPLIYHGNRRARPLKIEAAALPFHKLYDRHSGRLRYQSRAEIMDAFCLAKDTRLILLGSGRDKPIEIWWGLSTARKELLKCLAHFGIELITSPNYSLFTDQPRYDDMYNIKRIGIAWQEIVASNVPGALHLNARTSRDYDRLTQFIQTRPEVTEVAFEFGTGAAWPGRRPFHSTHLACLAQAVDRPLHLVIVGGLRAIPTLAPAFERLTYIDTTAFMTALHRQRIVEGNDGKLKKAAELTGAGVPVDSHLANNLEIMRFHVERRISETRT